MTAFIPPEAPLDRKILSLSVEQLSRLVINFATLSLTKLNPL
jgi:hypothetical protein